MKTTKKKSVKRIVGSMLGATALALSMSTAALSDDAARDINFKIKPQKMQSALLAFSEQAGVQLILAANTRDLPSSRGLTGKMESREALDMLIKGTDLEYTFTSANTVTVRKKPEPQPSIAVAQPSSQSQNSDSESTGAIEEIISVGTRAKGRTAIATPVPVDVVNAQALADTGQTEVGRMLQTLAPSFNFSSSSISDGTDALRPATLRGLGPDQTLVLVNGKRRHTSALLHVNTSVGRGASGVDMNAIPGAALGRIEVLRDGAAAQYGSDAIAGVINLVLKQGSEGGEVNVSYGQTYEGDGETFVANANAGFGLGDDGFINLTAEYRDRGNTNRAGLSGAVQYPLLDNGGACNASDNSGCDPREFDFDRQNFRIGDGDSEQKALVLNAELPIDDNKRFYVFGTYSDRENQTAGFYRRANQFNRTVIELYPDGFLPLINTTIEDYSLSGGIEWSLDSGWDLDFSINHGSNSFSYLISNSLNASFGVNSPTSAEAGTLGISQTTFNADAVKTFDFNGVETTIAFGAEYRDESFTIEAGEPVSYQDGGALNTNCPGCDVNPVPYSSGFQVFRGFSPANEVDEGRNNFSLYADVEAQITDSWMIAVAGRYEDYSDFGSTLNGKFSTRLEVTENFALRGSISTGFRAPSLQQKFSNSVSTQFVTVDGQTVAQERGTFRNDSEIARLAGVPELQEETSISFSGGFVATMGALTITSDYYHIEIDDRIGISAGIDLTQPGFEAVAGAASSGQFLLNIADTTTDGVDVVLTYDVELPGDQSLRLSASGNYTNTSVKDGSIVNSIGGVNVGPLFTPQDISIVEEWQPKTRINLSANYQTGPWAIIARLNQFGSYTVCEGACDTPTGAGQNVQDFGSKWLTDLQVSYTFGDSGLKLTVGANNLFDVTPDRNLIGQSRGGTIAGIVDSPGVFQFSRRSAPFGFNGGYWYARATYAF
ncbi:TonB-dependent receptor domain-containing protein [Kordiimonas laminariae]|uniref:TonB-dependent receptor domain-containing protein n=1 Tax=Kordiimonas laminariae TaxID=2917717 RepID=UPI001FF6B95B|nr:TonB-dependent receptor [Kordiimonas laminariae]